MNRKWCHPVEKTSLCFVFQMLIPIMERWCVKQQNFLGQSTSQTKFCWWLVFLTLTHQTKQHQTSTNQHKWMKRKSMLVSAAGKTPVELQRACLLTGPFYFHVTALPCGYVSIMKSGEGRQSTSPGRLKCPDLTQPLKWSTVRASRMFTHVCLRRE